MQYMNYDEFQIASCRHTRRGGAISTHSRAAACGS